MKRGYLRIYAKIMTVILILVAIFIGGIYFFENRYDNEKIETLKTNMLIIEAKTKEISSKVKMKEKDAKYIGEKIESIEDNESLKKLQNDGIIDISKKENNYYILNREDLEKLGLAEIKLDEDLYIIEYNSNEIIYSKGIETEDGNRLYKLTDIKNM